MEKSFLPYPLRPAGSFFSYLVLRIFGFEGMAACLFGGSGSVLMFTVEAFARELSIKFGIGMLVNLNHDHVSPASVAFIPVRAIGNRAFDFRHRYHLHYPVLPLPAGPMRS
jgi:hypothetical protein